MSLPEPGLWSEDTINELAKTYEGQRQLSDYLSTQCLNRRLDIARMINAMRTLGMRDAAEDLMIVHEFLKQPSHILSAITLAESKASIKQSAGVITGLLGLSLKDSDPELAKSIVKSATEAMS